MKTQTINGTKVEIVSIGDTHAVCTVAGRISKAQVAFVDLIRPEGELPPELEGIEFYTPPASPVVEPVVEMKTTVVPD